MGSVAFLAPLEAILFDIDGTLCDSDPQHYDAFRLMLQEGSMVEFPLLKNSSLKILVGNWDFQKTSTFMEEKKGLFQRSMSYQHFSCIRIGSWNNGKRITTSVQ
ncbi:haloacid dehalogenase-like hydrolase domain-containing protein Sgpp isoform X5 [Cannabis sativa]|uniref:haloacid dehalogenase-like hydrolase domain-containing protein Sgpp isoform X5 n=1 Tax=Cannabis sativa TaxID=3483 RepID=UPI0029CA8DB0|nr:haloacid dehalogenase-like hydrolase domain-containing protein Sgpp isoform X5 [Cannabis sativa]